MEFIKYNNNSKNKKLIDTCNCSYKSVGNYWNN